MLCGVVQEIIEDKKSGREVVKEIIEQARQERNASITISRLPLEAVAIYTEVFGFSARRLYKDLSSEFSHLGKLVAKLQNQGFTGYIEIRFSKREKQNVVFLERGKVKAILTEENQIGQKEKTQTELSLIVSEILEQAQSLGAVFDVFGLT